MIQNGERNLRAVSQDDLSDNSRKPKLPTSGSANGETRRILNLLSYTLAFDLSHKIVHANIIIYHNSKRHAQLFCFCTKNVLLTGQGNYVNLTGREAWQRCLKYVWSYRRVPKWTNTVVYIIAFDQNNLLVRYGQKLN